MGLSPEQSRAAGIEEQKDDPEPVEIEVLCCNWLAVQVWLHCQQTVEIQTATVGTPFGSPVTKSFRIYRGLAATEIDAAMRGLRIEPDAEVFGAAHDLGRYHAKILTDREHRK